VVKNLLSEDSLNKSVKKYKYSISEIMKILFVENPDITKEECYEKAKFFSKEIDKSNKQIVRNTKKYFKYNLPLSIFDDGDDIEI
jgi:hypothetical protein